MISRFFLSDPLPPTHLEGDEILLPEAVAHHALRVLRLGEGAPLVLFDGCGGEVAATLLPRGRQAWACLGARSSRDVEAPLRVVLVQGLAGGDKMDWIVQKAVELGAVAVQPLAAERSVLRLSGERAVKRLAHWRGVAVAACEQCGRNRLPEVRDLRALADYLTTSEGLDRRILAPGAEQSLAASGKPAGEVHVLVGPEGGWSEAELALALRAGCRPVGLGPRVLRTETAGAAALAAMQAWWGDFGV